MQLLTILLTLFAQVQMTTDEYFVIGDPVIDDGYIYFQGSEDILTTKVTNDLGTLYTFAHSAPEFHYTVEDETVELELPAYANTMIISAALSRIARTADNAWLLAIGDKEGYTYVWRIQSLEPEFMGSILIPNPTQITSLSFSYQSTKILIGTEYGRVFRYDLPLVPWILEYTDEGWHPRDDGYTDLYPIRINRLFPLGIGPKNAIVQYGAGQIMELTELGTGSDYEALIVHVTDQAGRWPYEVDLWILTKGIDPDTLTDYIGVVTLLSIPTQGNMTYYKQPALVPQNSQPLVFTFDSLYPDGVLGRSEMTCLSVDDITYYRLNIDDGFTTPYGGANFFYKESLPGKVRYWGAYRTDTPGTYGLPNYLYTKLQRQSTFNLCDGTKYDLYTWRNVMVGTTVEDEPGPFYDDTINYDRCDGVCPNYDYVDENDYVSDGPGWKLFELEKWVEGIYYDVSITATYGHWIFIQTGGGEVYNDLYLVDDQANHCGTTIPDCSGAVIIDINQLNVTNPYEEVIYVPLVAQSCNPYCLQITTDYTDRPVLKLTAQETDYIRIEQMLLRPNGLWGFNEDRWSEEFSITNGAKRPESLDWNYGTWTVEWPYGRGFDVNWYKIDLLDPNFVVEQEGESPLSETVYKDGQIGPFIRVDYYKTTDGYYSIINDADDNEVISVPGTIDIFDVITKEKPYSIYKRTDVPGDPGILGDYISELDAIVVYYDDEATYFLGELPPDCVNFTVDSPAPGTVYDCSSGFLPGNDVRFFEYTGSMPPGVYPDCYTGQDCIDTSVQEMNIFQSSFDANYYLFDGSLSITPDHCGVAGPDLSGDYVTIYLSFNPFTGAQETAALNSLSTNVEDVAPIAVLCHATSAGPTLFLFFATQGTINGSGTFDLDGESFTYSSYSSVNFGLYLSNHEDLAPEICVADDCYSDGVDCVDIPASSQVHEMGTPDGDYDYALASIEPLVLTEDHCFTKGAAYEERANYTAQRICVDEAEAETVRTTVYGALGDDLTHSEAGSAILVYVKRVDDRVYTYFKCEAPFPEFGSTVTILTHEFTSFVFDPSAFSIWAWSQSTLELATCKSSSTHVFKLDDTATQYEGEKVASKVDLIGYDDIVSQIVYEYTDESLIDIPWAGKFYDIMYVSPDGDYEILQEFADPHYISPMFSEEGEQVYEEEISVPYQFAEVDDSYEEGEYPVYHTEGESDFIGGYPPLPGEAATLWVMEGESTEGELEAVPECETDGTNCEDWEGENIIYLGPDDQYYLTSPGTPGTPCPYTERHCGLGTIFPTMHRDYYTFNFLDKVDPEDVYDTYVALLGQRRGTGGAFVLVWVELGDFGPGSLIDDIRLGIIHLTNPDVAYVAPAEQIEFFPGDTIQTNNMIAALNQYSVFTYDFGTYEASQLCVLGPYSNRNIIIPSYDTSTSKVYPCILSDDYILSDDASHAAILNGIVGLEVNPEFIPAGTTKHKGTLTALANIEQNIEGFLGRNYADTEDEYYIFAHYEVSGADLIVYFLNIGGIASPADPFYQTVGFGDLSITSATGEFYVYEYTRSVSPAYLAQSAQAGVLIGGHQFIDDFNHGYFSSNEPATPFIKGACGETIIEDWDKVYIDYPYSTAKVSELLSRAATPYIGWWQQSAPVSHFITGYDILGATLRVYFYLSNVTPVDTATGTDPVDIGGSFTPDGKTAADRVPTTFYLQYYDDKTSGNPTVSSPHIPALDEFYGWDCVSTENSFLYRNFTDVTWIVSSDETLVNDYRHPVIALKNDVIAGFAQYSRTYGPYTSKNEFDERWALLVAALGTDVRPESDPVVISHIRQEGNSIIVYYLLQGTTVVPTYTLGEYSFSMTLLVPDTNFDIITYDYPVLPSYLCKDYYSEKVETTTNFTADGGYTSSTVDLRGYTGLVPATFATDDVDLFYNLINYDGTEWITYVPALYSIPGTLTDARIYDDTWNYEIASSIFFKDKNMFATMLTPPLYEVHDSGGTTADRFDDAIGFLCAIDATPSERRAFVGEAVELTWDTGSTPGILTHYYDGILAFVLMVVVPQQWTTPVEHPLTVLEVTSFEVGGAPSITADYMRYFSFTCATDKPLGYHSIKNLRYLSSTVYTAIINAFYKEDSTTYHACCYSISALPANVDEVTWGDDSTSIVTGYTISTFGAARYYTNASNLIACKLYDTPPTWTYDEIDTTGETPAIFTKIENIVEYDNFLYDGDPINFYPSSPELGYHITINEGEEYLRLDPRLQRVSAGEEGEAILAGDLYTSAADFLVEGEIYVNFAVQEDVSEASPGYNSVYIDDDVHILERVKGPEKPVTYAVSGTCSLGSGVVYDGTNEGECVTAWEGERDINLTDLYLYTYEHQDYTVFLKDGSLWSIPSEGYDISPREWVLSFPEAFDILMDWINATEPVKDFFRVYFGLEACQNGTWDDPLDIPAECDNVVEGLEVSELLGIMETVFANNVVIDKFLVSEDVQKYWVIEDTPHLGLNAYMDLDAFEAICEEVGSETPVSDQDWFTAAATELWYDQTVPVGYNEYYYDSPDGDLSDAFNQVRIRTYLPILKELIPINVALDGLRQELRDWQYPNTDRLSSDSSAEISIRSTYIDEFVLQSSAPNTSYNAWALINILEPVALQSPRVVYLSGSGEIYVNNVWGTSPILRIGTDPHVSEYYFNVVRSSNNNLVLKGPKQLYYGVLMGQDPMNTTATSQLPTYGRFTSNTLVFDGNYTFGLGNILDPWGQSLYRYTVPSVEGTVFVWPREFMSTGNYPWEDPPGFLIVCD